MHLFLYRLSLYAIVKQDEHVYVIIGVYTPIRVIQVTHDSRTGILAWKLKELTQLSIQSFSHLFEVGWSKSVVEPWIVLIEN